MDFYQYKTQEATIPGQGNLKCKLIAIENVLCKVDVASVLEDKEYKVVYMTFKDNKVIAYYDEVK